ncbi:hypothetical protein DTL42_12845 [Bremerella cremea]|uniref:Uncharacterized protein n=1 Tax=Bremerella cremea TaxID=1031537 RepID=A0A368KUV9_9BACT|nr:hypothetical protein [Bremerella cremea]RCS49407.1 hypothetical protein DTL42_12845 [Bremerella cremea]
MTNPELEDSPPAAIRFSLSSVILWIAIAALILTNVMMFQEIREIKSHLLSSPANGQAMPISVERVAQQFAQNTNNPSTVTTKVEDVRYSPTEDTYLVSFSWTITATGKTWHSDVRLKGDGFGNYFGQIQSDQYNQPLGRTRPSTVVIQSPSPLTGNP